MTTMTTMTKAHFIGVSCGYFGHSGHGGHSNRRIANAAPNLPFFGDFDRLVTVTSRLVIVASYIASAMSVTCWNAIST